MTVAKHACETVARKNNQQKTTVNGPANNPIVGTPETVPLVKQKGQTMATRPAIKPGRTIMSGYRSTQIPDSKPGHTVRKAVCVRRLGIKAKQYQTLSGETFDLLEQKYKESSYREGVPYSKNCKAASKVARLRSNRRHLKGVMGVGEWIDEMPECQAGGMFDAVKDFLTNGVKVNHCVPGVDDYISRFRQMATDTLVGLSEVSTESIGSAGEKLEGLTQAVFDRLDTTMSRVLRMVWLAVMTSTAVFAWQEGTITKSVLMMCLGLLPTVLSDDFKGLCTHLIDTVRKHTTSTTPQSQGPFEPALCGSLIATICTFCTLPKGCDFKEATSRVHQRMSGFSGAVTGWSKLIAFAITNVEDALRVITNLFGLEPIRLATSGVAQVDSWCEKVQKLLTSSNSGNVLGPAEVMTLQRLVAEGETIANRIRFDPQASVVFNRTHKELAQLATINGAAMNSLKGERVLPVSLCIYGEPGIGKTLICGELMSHVLARTMDVERIKELNYDLGSEVFQKGSSQYWEGYTGQAGLVLDDFGQSRVSSSSGEDNEYNMVIRMINNWAFPLNFADLHNKGKNFFRSKLCMMTTNLDNINPEASVVINQPQAVARRLDFPYRMGVHEEFCAPGCGPFSQKALDYGKFLRERAQEEAFPWHIWFLCKHDFLTGNSEEPRESVKSVLDKIVQKMKDNANNFEAGVEPRRAMVKALVQDREREAQEHQVVDEVITDLVKTEHVIGPEPEAQGGLYTSAVATVREALGIARPVATQLVQPRPLPKPPAVARPDSDVYVSEGESFYDCQEPPMQYYLQRLADMRAECKSLLMRAKTRVTNNPMLSLLVGSTSVVMLLKLVRVALNSYNMSGMVSEAGPVNEHFIQNRPTPVYGDTLRTSVMRNLLHVHTLDAKKNVRVNLGCALGLYEHTLMMPRHFITSLTTAVENMETGHDTEVVFTRVMQSEAQFTVPFSALSGYCKPAVPGVEEDLLIMDFTGALGPCFKDITDKFIRAEDVATLRQKRKFSIHLEGVELTRTGMSHCVKTGEAEIHNNYAVKSREAYTVTQGMKYKIATSSGDCGSIVCLGSDCSFAQPRLLAGFHTAGIPQLGLGFSATVTRDMVETFKPKRVLVEDHTDPNIERQSGDFAVKGSFLPMYKTHKGSTTSPHTGIVRTRLFEKWHTVTKAPARLSPFTRTDGTRVYPMVGAISKYSGQVKLYNKVDVATAAHVAFAPLFMETRNEDRSVVDFRTAVEGNVDLTFVDAIPRGTSAGYPYVTKGVPNGKKEFFGYGERYEFDSPQCKQLEADVADTIHLAEQGIRKLHVFVDFLKDEKRTFPKVEAGDTRLISAAPLVYTIAFRQYFLSFMAAMLRSRIYNGVAAGVNVYSEWDALARHLLGNSPNIVAGDFKAFDASEQPQIHWAILDKINEWYDDGPVNARVRRILWYEVVNSRHLGGTGTRNNNIYEWAMSLASGHPGTTAINSMDVLVLMVLCYLQLGRSAAPGLPPEERVHTLPEAFWDNVAICVLGDDNVQSIKDRVLPWYNQESIALAMANNHMTYTNEKKDGEVPRSRDITEVDFLKRAFRHDSRAGPNGAWVAPLSIDTILEVPYWCKNAKYLETVMQSNFEMALTELSAHEQEVWDEWAPKMKKAYTDLGYYPKCVDRDAYFSRFMASANKH